MMKLLTITILVYIFCYTKAESDSKPPSGKYKHLWKYCDAFSECQSPTNPLLKRRFRSSLKCCHYCWAGCDPINGKCINKALACVRKCPNCEQIKAAFKDLVTKCIADDDCYLKRRYFRPGQLFTCSQCCKDKSSDGKDACMKTECPYCMIGFKDRFDRGNTVEKALRIKQLSRDVQRNSLNTGQTTSSQSSIPHSSLDQNSSDIINKADVQGNTISKTADENTSGRSAYKQ